VNDTQTFVIPGRLASANELIGGMNRNRFVGAQVKKKNTELCANYAMLIKPITQPVGIRIRWIERDSRRDLDNIAFGIKFILDGLVISNKIPNDTRHWVKSIIHEFPDPERFNPRIEVFLIPA
jgi:hypothetical protein